MWRGKVATTTSYMPYPQQDSSRGGAKWARDGVAASIDAEIVKKYIVFLRFFTSLTPINVVRHCYFAEETRAR